MNVELAKMSNSTIGLSSIAAEEMLSKKVTGPGWLVTMIASIIAVMYIYSRRKTINAKVDEAGRASGEFKSAQIEAENDIRQLWSPFHETKPNNTR